MIEDHVLKIKNLMAEWPEWKKEYRLTKFSAPRSERLGLGGVDTAQEKIHKPNSTKQ